MNQNHPMFKNAFLVIEFELLAFWGDKPGLLRNLIEPFAYLFLLAGGLQGVISLSEIKMDYMSFVYPGIITLQLFRMFTHSVYRLTIDRRWGLQAIKMTSGTSSMGYIVGVTLVPLILFILQTLLTAPFASMLGAKISLNGLISLILVGMIAIVFWVSLAIICTFYFKKYSQRDLFISFLFLPLSLSAPIFYSLDNAPNYLKIVSALNPLSYQVQAMREAFLGNLLTPTFYIMVIISVLFLFIAKSVMHGAEYLPSEV